MTRARVWSLLLVLGLVACTSDLAVPTEPLRLLRPEWGVAYVGEAFEGALRPAGGLRPYRFELADGELPPGLSLAAGRLVGTPTEVGRFSFTALVQDGNLSQAVLRVELEVRELPTPVVRIDTPATEVRGALPLVVRVEDARGWLGARLALSWDPAAFELSAGPTAGDARLVVFHDAAEGRLLLEAAALGAARQGAFTLARFSLRPVAGPARPWLEVVATTRYAGGDHTARRLEGARPEAPLPVPSDRTPGSGGGNGAGDDGAEEREAEDLEPDDLQPDDPEPDDPEPDDPVEAP